MVRGPYSTLCQGFLKTQFYSQMCCYIPWKKRTPISRMKPPSAKVDHIPLPVWYSRTLYKKSLNISFTVQHHFSSWGFFFKKPLFSSLSNLIQRLRLTVITGIWYLLVKLCLQEYCQCLLSWHLMSCLRGYLKILMWTGQLTNNCKTVKILMPLEFLVVTSILKKETPRSPAITWNWFAYWPD